MAGTGHVTIGIPTPPGSGGVLVVAKSATSGDRISALSSGGPVDITLEPGTYSIGLEQLPTGYFLGEAKTVTIDADKATDVALEVVTGTTLQLNVLDDNSTAVPNAVFVVRRGDVDEATLTTTAAGQVTSAALAPGTIVLHQTVAPVGLTTAPDVQVDLQSGTPKVVGVRNPHGAILTIAVTSDAGAPVPNAEFSVLSGTATLATLTTGTNGTVASAPLAPGAVTLHQTKAPDGFVASADTAVTLVSGAVVAAIVDQRSASLSVKVLAQGAATSAPGLAGAVIVVSGPDQYSKTFNSEPGGTNLTGLKAGQYTIEERIPPSQHESESDQRVVTLALGDAKNVTIYNKSLSTPSKRHGWAIAFCIVVVLAFLGVGGLQVAKHRWDWVAAATVLAVGLGLLTLINWNDRGFLSPLVGDDGRVSTSKVQVGIWTVAVVWVLSFLVGRVVFGTDLPKGQQPRDAEQTSAVLKKVIPDDYWPSYLVLLGGPFAAAVLAKGIVSTRIQNGTLQKSISDADQASIDQVFKDDADQTDLVDSQYLLFNLVALGYFLVEFVQRPVLPEMPDVLLALTSGAAALYVGNKAVTTNAPTITSITPASARQGQVVTIGGQNFVPADSDDGDNVSVSIDGIGPVRVVSSTNRAVQIEIPPGASEGTHNVVLTTPLRVSADPWPLRIEADQAQVLGVVGGSIKRNEPFQLLGRYFKSSADVSAATAIVWIGGAATTGTVESLGDGTERVTVPPAMIAADVKQVAVAVQSTRGIRSIDVNAPVEG